MVNFVEAEHKKILISEPYAWESMNDREATRVYQDRIEVWQKGVKVYSITRADLQYLIEEADEFFVTLGVRVNA